MTALADAVRLDAELALLSRAETALRLRLGQALEVLGRGACSELGFSSLSAYALERCERGMRWVESARCLARRLEALPVLRRAVAFGEMSWSKAVLIARVATPRDEASWVQSAQRLTVRKLAAQLSESAARSDTPSDDTQSDDTQSDDRQWDETLVDDDGAATLVCTVDREEAWLFEATRALLRQLGVHDTDGQLEALLAESQTTLLDGLPKGALDLEATTALEARRDRWREQLERWRAEVEAFCEAHLHEERSSEKEKEVGRASATRSREAPRGSERSGGGNTLEQTILAAARGCVTLEALTPRELDGVVRHLARALAEQELALSRLILELHRLGASSRARAERGSGWFLLGYASEAHYARERLGMSRSSLLAKRALAERLEALPRIALALSSAQIGVEAALQIVRIATPSTERAWVERAEQRTIKHLKEEVDAALTAVRVSGQADCPPPTEAEIDAFHGLERAAASGRIFEPASNDAASGNAADARGAQTSSGEPDSTGRSAWHTTLDSLKEWLTRGVQMCAGHKAATSPAAGKPSVAPAPAREVQTSAGAVHRVGRVVLRLRVSRSVHGWWRGLEKQARRWLPAGMSWLRFCCLSLWRAWRHLLAPDVAYDHIYLRDRWRCTSPVCRRADVTPHHVVFRSSGGGDVEDNVTALCVECHLFGVHRGRIRVQGKAPHRLRWELGSRSDPCVVVHGRDRVAA